MYQRWVHFLMVHGLIYAVFAPFCFLLNVYSMFCCVHCYVSKYAHRSGRRQVVALTLFVFQITTVETTAMKRAAVTPVQVLSLSVTVAAASLTTGPAMGIMTVGITVMRPTPTAPIKVSVPTRQSAQGESSGSCSKLSQRKKNCSRHSHPVRAERKTVL